MRRAHCHVSGRVQGVGFRYQTADRARELGLTGYVRNLPDGRVEVVAEGADDTVQRLVDWLELGPPTAEVDQVERRFTEATGRFTGFGIAH